MIDQLSRFDAPTALAAGVNSVSATLNNRKEFLADLGLLNRIGLKQDGVEVTEDGTLRIGDQPLDAINAVLADHGLGELTVVPTGAFRRSLGETYRRLPATGLHLVNPAPVPELLSDKALQYWEWYDSRVVVPPWQPLDHYLRTSPDDTFDALREEFIADAPLVLKARNSTQGRNIWFYPGGIDDVIADWRTGAAPEALLQAPGRFLLQYAIPHEYDMRVLSAGDTPVSGERRYGSPDTAKSNLNLVETDASSMREAASELLTTGAVEPLAVDRLDPAVERAVTDLHATLRDLTDVAGGLHTWIGWDFLVVDPDDDRLGSLPDDVLHGLFDERYRTRQGRYLVFGEGNLSPGSKERYVNAVAHGRAGLDRDSAANLLRYGTSISRNEPFDPGVPDALDRDRLAACYGV